ncbi:MAG: UDP-glucose 4-epimerase GalE, partial [Desulfobacterales bacterium]|nr:UDP-glucose 4-epimerase GalE [Desulfobacterales bacterium]
YPIEAVMHFAAFSQVGESVANPLKYYRNNVAGTVALLAAMERHAVRRLIFSSTAAVYGEPQALPIVEDHPCRPTNPYGFTKLAVERLLADCEAAHGLKYMSLRYFNAAGADEAAAIGERHEPETHLIPLVLQVAAQRRDRIAIFGTRYPTRDGTCIRDYVHVGDLARAHLLALEALFNGHSSNVFNLGCSQGFSVREIIETARRVTGHPIPAIEADPRSGDPAVLIAGSNKIREQLGWTPRYENVEDIVRSAWAWHRKEAQRGGGRSPGAC